MKPILLLVNVVSVLAFIDKPEQAKSKSLEEQIYERWGDEALDRLGVSVAPSHTDSPRPPE